MDRIDLLFKKRWFVYLLPVMFVLWAGTEIYTLSRFYLDMSNHADIGVIQKHGFFFNYMPFLVMVFMIHAVRNKALPGRRRFWWSVGFMLEYVGICVAMVYWLLWVLPESDPGVDRKKQSVQNFNRFGQTSFGCCLFLLSMFQFWYFAYDAWAKQFGGMDQDWHWRIKTSVLFFVLVLLKSGMTCWGLYHLLDRSRLKRDGQTVWAPLIYLGSYWGLALYWFLNIFEWSASMRHPVKGR